MAGLRALLPAQPSMIDAETMIIVNTANKAIAFFMTFYYDEFSKIMPTETTENFPWEEEL
jgi:hypothetical protein